MSLIFAFQNFTFILFSVCIYDFAIIIIESKILDFFKGIIIEIFQLHLLNIIFIIIQVYFSLNDFQNFHNLTSFYIVIIC